MPVYLSVQGTQDFILQFGAEVEVVVRDAIDPQQGVGDSVGGDCLERSAVLCRFVGRLALPDLVCSKLAPADWLTSLFCDPEGCEPVSPEHATARRKPNPISKAPTSAMSHACRTTARLPIACVFRY